MTRQRQRLASWLRALFLIGLALVLELLCRLGVIPPFTMVAPSTMVSKLWTELTAGHYSSDILYTATNVAASIAISVFGGAALGALIHALPRLRRVLEPLLASYYSVPTFVFYPVLIVMFGLSRWPLVAIGALFGVVAMIINTMNGLDGIPPVLTKAGRMFRLDRWRMLWHVRLPAIAPALFTGVKLAVTYSVIGVIAGEFILSVAGLGKRIKLAYDDLDNPSMYALLLFMLSAIVVIYLVVHHVERRIHRRWSA